MTLVLIQKNIITVMEYKNDSKNSWHLQRIWKLHFKCFRTGIKFRKNYWACREKWIRKTTLLKILFALVHSPKVSVEIEGNKLYVDNQNWKSRLFFSPETNIIPDLFKMADVEKFYSRFYKNWNSKNLNNIWKNLKFQTSP